PVLRPGEARTREGRKSNAPPDRPEERPGQDAEIAPSHGKPRKGGQPQGDKRRGNDEYPLQAQSVHEPRGSPSADEEEDRRRRKKRETRIQWRVAKDLLQVDGQDDERAGRGAHDQRENVRGWGRSPAHEGQRHQGRLRPIFDDQEGRQSERGQTQRECRLDREEAVRRGNRERVYEENQAGRDRHGTRDIETPRCRSYPAVPRDEP